MSYRNLQDEVRALSHIDKLKLLKYITTLLLKEHKAKAGEANSFDQELETLKKELGLEQTTIMIDEAAVHNRPSLSSKIVCTALTSRPCF